MRQVQLFKWDRNPDQPNKYDKIDNGTGTFHQFSSGYEEFENGPGNYAVAIVERADGTVETVPADLIRFIDPIKSTAIIDGLVAALKAAERIVSDRMLGGCLVTTKENACEVYKQIVAALAAVGAQ